MNLLLLESRDVDVDGVARVDGQRTRHIVQVLGAGIGDRLRVGVVGGGRGYGTVLAIEEDGLALRIELEPGSDSFESARRPPIDLVLALPRPQALKRVLEHVSTLGVGAIDLVNSWRVEKSYFSSPQLDPETMRRRLIVGAEQGMTTWVPRVSIRRLLVPFIEGMGLPGDEQRLLAHPGATADIEDVFRPGAARTVIAIGPEGGWIDREIDTLSKAGFVPIRLGGRVLRVETAVVAALAQLALLERQTAPSSC